MDVTIPSVGESITSGLIASWHKKDGEAVKAGDVLLTLETDKVSTEITAEKSGVLRIKAQEGQEVKISEVVAVIEEGGAASQKPAGSEPKKKAAKEPEVLPPAPTGRVETPEPLKRSAPQKAVGIHPVPQEAPPPQPPTEEPAASAPPANAPADDDSRVSRKRLSPLRRKIAAQLVMAQQTAAILTTFNECDMSAVMTLRKQMQDSFQKQHGVKLGFMSFFVKAAVAALKAVPQVNSRLEGEGDLLVNHYFDIGVAVGTEKGLVVPVIREADRKSFAEIEQDILDYAGKAREGKIKLEDLQGGVFTISNGGVYGSLLSTPILNPPQSGILGLHKIQDRPMAVNGQVMIRPMMYLALSYDHRVVDGKEAVTFLVHVKEAIENPVRLLLEV